MDVAVPVEMASLTILDSFNDATYKCVASHRTPLGYAMAVVIDCVDTMDVNRLIVRKEEHAAIFSKIYRNVFVVSMHIAIGLRNVALSLLPSILEYAPVPANTVAVVDVME